MNTTSSISMQSGWQIEAVDIQPSQPRVAGKQKHGQNTKADTPEQYYLSNLGTPFTDQLIMELDDR